jgi:site-specific DNA-methyltransferase (cytosine-N4-specific)
LIDAVHSESWDYTDADTQHLTHNIHRYSGKFIPQIASRAVALLTLPGQLVLDPYCGSGTTLVESVLLKRRAIGIDLNPLAVLIARTKVTPVPTKHLECFRRELAQELAHLDSNHDMPLFPAPIHVSKRYSSSRDPRLDDPWFRKWFQPKILEQLIAIDHAIRSINDARKQDIAWVAFSDMLRKSSNAHSGYPNVMFHRNAPQRSSPLRPFLNSLDRVCEMIASLEKADAQWSDAQVQLGSACALPLPDCSVDAIVSHPPYIGSIPYAEYGALSLKWLGTDPKQLDKELTGGRRQSPDVVRRFREGYAQMLLEASRVLRPHSYAFLMVGNPLVRGKIVDLAAMTMDLADRAGFKLVVRATRNGVNRRANKMGAEHLLFFKKPAPPGKCTHSPQSRTTSQPSKLGTQH